QARAGRITDPSEIVQAPAAQNKVRVGDFLLANDRIAVYLEKEGLSDGYLPFGGEILEIEPIGPSGRPLPSSYFGESAILFGLQATRREGVWVLADGSEGGAAIFRVSGALPSIPMLDAFSAISPDKYVFPAALDYILEPGAPAVKLRLNIANTRQKAVDFT